MSVVRLVGNADLVDLARRWIDDFTSESAFGIELARFTANEAVIPYLSMRKAEIGLLTRRPTRTESLSYRIAMQGEGLYDPVLFTVGSISSQGPQVYLAANCRPDAPIASSIQELLSYVLGGAGQDIARQCFPDWVCPDETVIAINDGQLSRYAPEIDQDIAAYDRKSNLSGRISSVGAIQMRSIMNAWMDGFQAHSPEVIRGENWLHEGSSLGMAGLIAGACDLAPSGRQPWAEEKASFEAVHPDLSLMEIRVARGNLAAKGKTNAYAIYVAAANPVTALTLDQLTTIFASDAATLSWGKFGAKGSFSDYPILPITPGRHSGATRAFQRIVLGDRQWGNAPEMKNNPELPAEPGAISFGPANEVPEAMKTIAVKATEDSPPVAASVETVASGAYPLGRSIYIHLSHSTSKPVAPHIKEFLRYVLSLEGQRCVIPHGYYPLSEPELAAERGKLDIN